MALSPTFGLVAPNDLITATHHNNVRANIIRIDDRGIAEPRALGPHSIRYVPPDPVSGAAGVWTTIATIGTIIVPSVAEALVADVYVSGILMNPAPNDPIYLLRLVCGSIASGGGDASIYWYGANVDRKNVGFSSHILNPTAGSQSLHVQVSRIGGTGTCLVNSGTIITATLEFRRSNTP